MVSEASRIADYVLTFNGQKLAVIEAKRVGLPDTEGVAQAKRYATKLQIRFAYSTNGQGIYRIDMDTGEEGYVEGYPTPQELWNDTFTAPNLWRDRFAQVPFEDKGGTWEARYYQHNAINQALESIADNRGRILLTLATGTGKTFIAFQLAWKLSTANGTPGTGGTTVSPPGGPGSYFWLTGIFWQARPTILFLRSQRMP